jgi:uncharacterized protein YcfL
MSILKNSLTLYWSQQQEIVPLQTKHTRALLSSRMSSVSPRNSDASETGSNLEQSSKLNIHYGVHWWKLDPLEIHSRRRSVCIVFHANAACYIGETSRPLEVRIKEHKYNLTQGMLKKSKLAQHSYEEDYRICWNEAKVLQIEPNTIYRKYKESAHISARTSDQSTQCGYLSHLDTCHHNRNQETPAPSNVVGVDNFCFLCWHQKEYCFYPGVTSF